MLDLGCGPGTATLPLAKRVGSVIAVDLDADMVRQGRRLAGEAGANNVEWVNLAAESVDYPDGHFQEAVLEQSGFRTVSVSYVPFVQEWTVERFLGFLRSTIVSTRPAARN